MSSNEKPTKSNDIVVFEILRDSACAECGEKLGKGRWLSLEKDRPLCLSCADLAHLVFLPSGDAALTRRAGRYSSLKAVLVRFSRSRNRYERQGILVEEAALLAFGLVLEQFHFAVSDRREVLAAQPS